MTEANWNYMSNMTAENAAKFDALIAKVGAAQKVIYTFHQIDGFQLVDHDG